MPHVYEDFDNAADHNEEELSKRVGERIKEIRKYNGLTQTELGNRLNPPLNQNRIQQYENNTRTPKLAMLKDIANALGVETMALLNPVNTNPISLMYSLFEIEELYDLQLTKDEKGQIYLSFGHSSPKSETINDNLEEWYKIKQDYLSNLNSSNTKKEKDEIIRKYKMWKWNYPSTEMIENHAREEARQLREQAKSLEEMAKEIESKVHNRN